MRHEVLCEWMNISFVQMRVVCPILKSKERTVSEMNSGCELSVLWFPLTCPLSLHYRRWEITLNGKMSVMMLLCLWMHTFQKLELTFSSTQSWRDSIVVHLWSTQSSNEPWLMSSFMSRTLPHKCVRHTILIKPGPIIIRKVLSHTWAQHDFMGAGRGSFLTSQKWIIQWMYLHFTITQRLREWSKTSANYICWSVCYLDFYWIHEFFLF